MSDIASSQAIMFEPAAASEHEFEPASGHEFEPAAASGHELKPAGSPEHELEPAGSPEHELKPAGSPEHELEPADDPEREPSGDLTLRAARGRSQADREQITFEQGYEELKQIVARLDDPELPIHEMFEAFRRGKGLEKTLRAYLQEREGELVELEEGNNLAEFEIVSPTGGSVAAGQ